jgi:hypothetical protein
MSKIVRIFPPDRNLTITYNDYVICLHLSLQFVFRVLLVLVMAP